MFVFMLSSLSGEFGRFRRGTLQMVNAEFGRQLINDRAARKATRKDAETVECLACLVECAVERDPSVTDISQEISDEEEEENPRESLDDIERENARFESERQFDKFASEDD
ncbi:MAG: hypothetical protein IID45_15450 [Planctomycetes bacterium]|nr:hypothetical protein [Planctomycetota bacterium]